jgi:hypothetical protein
LFVVCFHPQVPPLAPLPEFAEYNTPLAGQHVDGGHIRELWLDRLHVGAFQTIGQLGTLIGTDSTSISFGSGPFAIGNRASADAPYAFFGGKDTERSMSTRSGGAFHAAEGKSEFISKSNEQKKFYDPLGAFY